MTIKACRRRKRFYKKLIDNINYLDFDKMTMEEIIALELAIKRSFAIEELNIQQLKEKERIAKEFGIEVIEEWN